VISVPEPTIVLIVPAATPAARTASASQASHPVRLPTRPVGAGAGQDGVHGAPCPRACSWARRARGRPAGRARAAPGASGGCPPAAAVAVQEGPVPGGVRARRRAHPHAWVERAGLAVVAHPVHVRTARGVRLGRHRAAVRVLGHADHIGHHHPVVAVDERAVEPVGDLARVVAALQRPSCRAPSAAGCGAPSPPRGRSAGRRTGTGHAPRRPRRDRRTRRAAVRAPRGRWSAGSPRRGASRRATRSPASPPPAGRTPPRCSAAPGPGRAPGRRAGPPRRGAAVRGSSARTASSATSSGHRGAWRPRAGRSRRAGP
jgi:mRNA-degrading endonuclease toxin of MazEF toxin-antitoxin module